jgi:inosine-uridine nucleoside N-ribohydrolase
VAAVHGCFGHDVLAFIYLVAPQLFQTQAGQIRVATDGLAQGQTILKRQAGIAYPQAGWEPALPSSSACMSVDAAACSALFEATMLRDWLPA